MTVRVVRKFNDGKSRRVWEFVINSDVLNVMLRLVRFEIQHAPNGGWRKATAKERWDAFDERYYYSGIPRPTEIPPDVVVEAMCSMVVDVQIKGTGAENRVGKIKITSAELV